MNLGKDRMLRSIDLPPAIAAGEGEVIDSVANTTPPSYAIAPTPTDLALQTGVNQSDRSATSWVEATWAAPSSTQPGQYIVQLATDSGFTANVVTRVISAPPVGETPRYRFLSLRPGAVYYVHVACSFYEPGPYGATVSITSAQDTTPPGQPTSVAAAMQTNGDLVVTGTSPGESNVARIIIVIRGVAAGPVYATLEVPSTPGQAFRSVWTAADNVRQSGGGDASLVVEVQSQSWSGYSSAALTYSPTKSVPTAPTVSVDFSGEDAVYTLALSADTVRLSFVADTGLTARALAAVGRVVYDYDQNRLDHSGTADPSLSYSVVAYDALGQASTATTGTATNAAPSAPTVTLQSGWQLLLGRITSAAPADFEAYEWAWESSTNGGSSWSSVRTEEGRTAAQELENTTDGAIQYRVKVRTKDTFGQYSTQATSNAVTIDGFSMAAYRAAAKYTDSNSNTEATLAVLRDDNKASGGVAYAQWTSGWRWTQVERGFLDRYMTITVALTAAVGYVGVSKDGVAWSWYSGPYAADGRTLQAVASESAAQTAAVALPVDGRIDLPSPVEARFIRLGHRNTTAAYTIYEFYPRTVVEGDDIRGQTIKGYMIASRTVQADHMVAGTITANEIAAGAITATNIAADAINGKTITGATIQTAASGARSTLTSSGFSTYAETLSGLLDSTVPQAAYKILDDSGATVAALSGYKLASSGARVAYLHAPERLELGAGTTPASPGAFIRLTPSGIMTWGSVSMLAGGLNLGSASGAAAGELKASGNITASGAVYSTNWFRSYGTSGWYNETYGGGMWMSDSTWVRVYGGKSFVCENTAKVATFISDGNGSFGSGSVPSTNRLYTKGATSDSTQNALLAQNSNGSNLMYLRNDGYSWVNQNWAVGSDRKLKENIANLGAHLYQALLQLRPVAYDYITGAKAQYGFIAQEVQPILPALVSQNDDGYLSITMSNLIPLLVGLLQQHEQRLRVIEETKP